MGWYFAFIIFIAYIISFCLYAELQKECDYWEREAKKWCDKLFNIRVLVEGADHER